MPKYEVTAILDRETSVQETSKLFEGLYRLERTGCIRFTIKPCAVRNSYPRVVRLAARFGEVERDIAIDLSDQRDLFHLPDLEPADIYFKRSFHPSALAHLPPRLAEKVQPFGLNNPAASLGTALRLLRARFQTRRGTRDLAADARQLLALPSPGAFECAPDVPAEPLVVFQTRLWPSEEADVIAVNEDRAALMRALRKAFGDRFIGGAIPSDFAQKHYGDVVSRFPSRMRTYPDLMKRALVGVYSKGLHDSMAFKMSEYLAASRCIVAQPQGVVLPEPLIAGTHYLAFSSPDECIARCEQLIIERERAAEMRRRNWTYYRSQAEPAAHMLRILDRSFAPPEPGNQPS